MVTINPEDYFLETKNLKTGERGLHLMLLLYLERFHFIDDDNSKLAEVCKISVSAWERHRKNLEPFFLIKDDKWHMKRKVDVRVSEVFDYWARELGHERAKLTSDRRRKVSARLAEGYTVAQLKAAIDGIKNSPHHMGKNDQGVVYDDLELICRSGSHVERFAAMKARKVVRADDLWQQVVFGDRESLPKLAIEAARSIGGVDAIRNCNRSELKWKRKDFLAALRRVCGR